MDGVHSKIREIGFALDVFAPNGIGRKGRFPFETEATLSRAPRFGGNRESVSAVEPAAGLSELGPGLIDSCRRMVRRR